MSGGQDLINLAIGRRDLDLYYLPGRFNAQLAFPGERTSGPVSRGWMGDPHRAARNPTAGFGVPREFFKHLVPPSNRTRFPRFLRTVRSSASP